ncbi:hypothetical protein LCGC14_0465380 [marine sediment metagenome]|uniref:Uncharacterized protein n=1 Tax=marine sediment metagenome TaxID=412755 RepID=A0A0F9SIU4_9ZZZZ
MDHKSLTQYVGKTVKLILRNGFWYKAKITNVSEEAIDFIELKGNHVSVHPSMIMMIEEVGE